MVLSSQPDISVLRAVMTSNDAVDTVLDSASHLVVPDVLSVHVSEILGPAIGYPLLMQMVRTVSDWESILIVVLFLMISALVGIRVTEAMSDREMSVPTQALSADDQPDPVQEDEPAPAEQPPTYENVVSAETPPELLSDEGQVVRLLVENHGRIRQHQIADETGWSKSKVSRTLSKMHDNGTIEKTSLGRENVITLAREDIDDPNQSDSDNVGNPVA